jgi:tetratricopeptide (TPR) repeat protein
VVELSDQFGDRDSVTVGDATLYRAVATQALGRPREAIPYFERAIEILGRRIGRTDHRVTRAIGELGVLLSDRDAAKAIALLDEAVANEAAAGDVEAGALAHRRQLEMLRARKH